MMGSIRGFLYNQKVKGTVLENWRNRHVDEIAEKLMEETAVLINYPAASGGELNPKGLNERFQMLKQR